MAFQQNYVNIAAQVKRCLPDGVKAAEGVFHEILYPAIKGMMYTSDVDVHLEVEVPSFLPPRFACVRFTHDAALEDSYLKAAIAMAVRASTELGADGRYPSPTYLIKAGSFITLQPEPAFPSRKRVFTPHQVAGFKVVHDTDIPDDQIHLSPQGWGKLQAALALLT